MDFLMYFEGQALYTANGPFHVLWVCVPTVFMCLLSAEFSECCFAFALQPLQVFFFLEPARVLSTWKTRSWLWILYFFPSRCTACVLRKKQFAWTQWVNSPNKNLAEKELAGICFTDPQHQGTKSYERSWITDSQNADSLHLTVFSPIA